MRELPKIKSIIGIDQTGAVSPNGKPKPLFASLLDLSQRIPLLTTQYRLPQLTQTELLKFLDENKAQLPTLVVVDSALGLPKALGVSVFHLLEASKDYRYRHRDYGAETAAHFFRSFLSTPSPPFPQRKAEQLAGANSVFQLHPFQKNIGCGTFRVLKELAQEAKWFHLWPYEPFCSTGFTLAEGYPSLFWKLILKAKARHLSLLHQYLKVTFPHSHLPKNTDDADATLLAMGGWHCLQSGFFENFPIRSIHRSEGWILGLDPKG